MALLLIRHGETALNAARVLQPADTPLSARGLAQAQALAQRLAAPAGFGAPVGLLASDLPRAQQTAAAIAQRTGLPVQHSPLLQERNYGELRGRPYDGLGFNPLTMVDAPPGGESQAEFSARADAAWQALLALQQRLGGPLAVVTHGLVLREWLLRRFALPAGMVAPTRFSNASITVASAVPPHTLQCLDDTGHLSGSLRDDGHSLSGG
ncbi:MAG: histidine phosphatase family protein [Burkholderiales bacterium]|nr:histidine phosphatase family protein [Burkholderiales bacterium]